MGKIEVYKGGKAMSKYFNDAIIGNSNILGCITSSGELIRLYYPDIDYYQNIDIFRTGIIENNRIFWLHEGNVCKQYYKGNVLYTEIDINNIHIIQKDYILNDKNILIRKYNFTNNINFFVYSKLNSNIYKLISGMIVNNALIQYSQDVYSAVFSNYDISNYQINNAQNSLQNGNLNPVDYIGMSDDSAICYNNISEITLYIALENNLKSIMDTIIWAKKQEEEKLFNDTIEFWDKYLAKAKKNSRILFNCNEKENKIIERSILAFALLSNKNTGGILTSPDVDEGFTRCGRYGYCWPRDALFISKALVLCGMKDIVNKFYNIWARKAQLDSGLFEQRYYTNGNLAPSWGVQIDETASIIIGINEFGKCREFEDIIFNATKALLDFVSDDFVSKPCYDIWEERRGVHLYSTASIYGALKISRKMLLKIDNNKYKKIILMIEKVLPKIKEATNRLFIENGRLKRSIDNNQIDISALGTVVPFDMFEIESQVINNAICDIENKLKLENGGYLRYQDDSYIGGNAWIISSLWLALIYIKKGNINKVKELFDWVTNHADYLNFLPEQIDKNSDKTVWIKQLAWSHAMYIIVASELGK
jgi:oligosaccharide amylase